MTVRIVETGVAFIECDEVSFNDGKIILQTRDGEIKRLNPKVDKKVSVYDYGILQYSWVSTKTEFKKD